MKPLKLMLIALTALSLLPLVSAQADETTSIGARPDYRCALYLRTSTYLHRNISAETREAWAKMGLPDSGAHNTYLNRTIVAEMYRVLRKKGYRLANANGYSKNQLAQLAKAPGAILGSFRAECDADEYRCNASLDLARNEMPLHSQTIDEISAGDFEDEIEELADKLPKCRMK